MKKFIFDVDGTLTPSRQRIDEEFLSFFFRFTFDNDVYYPMKHILFYP